MAPEALAVVLRRQIAELQTVMRHLSGRGESPNDNAQLRDSLLELQSFRKMLDAIERELGRGHGTYRRLVRA